MTAYRGGFFTRAELLDSVVVYERTSSASMRVGLGGAGVGIIFAETVSNGR